MSGHRGILFDKSSRKTAMQSPGQPPGDKRKPEEQSQCGNALGDTRQNDASTQPGCPAQNKTGTEGNQVVTNPGEGRNGAGQQIHAKATGNKGGGNEQHMGLNGCGKRDDARSEEARCGKAQQKLEQERCVVRPEARRNSNGSNRQPEEGEYKQVAKAAKSQLAHELQSRVIPWLGEMEKNDDNHTDTHTDTRDCKKGSWIDIHTGRDGNVNEISDREAMLQMLRDSAAPDHALNPSLSLELFGHWV
jgi:hypothetical protein